MAYLTCATNGFKNRKRILKGSCFAEWSLVGRLRTEASAELLRIFAPQCSLHSLHLSNVDQLLHSTIFALLHFLPCISLRLCSLYPLHCVVFQDCKKTFSSRCILTLGKSSLAENIPFEIIL